VISTASTEGAEFETRCHEAPAFFPDRYRSFTHERLAASIKSEMAQIALARKIAPIALTILEERRQQRFRNGCVVNCPAYKG
jgi:hypothetical protein